MNEGGVVPRRFLSATKENLPAGASHAVAVSAPIGHFNQTTLVQHARRARATRPAQHSTSLARSPHTGSGRLARAPHHVDRAKISPLQVILSSLSTACGHISPHEVTLPFLVFLHPQNYTGECSEQDAINWAQATNPMSLVTSPSFGTLRTSQA